MLTFLPHSSTSQQETDVSQVGKCPLFVAFIAICDDIHDQGVGQYTADLYLKPF